MIDDVDEDGPWGVYRCTCLGCGEPLLYVERVEDVETGRVSPVDGYCTRCSTGIRPSKKPEYAA